MESPNRSHQGAHTPPIDNDNTYLDVLDPLENSDISDPLPIEEALSFKQHNHDLESDTLPSESFDPVTSTEIHQSHNSRMEPLSSPPEMPRVRGPHSPDHPYNLKYEPGLAMDEQKSLFQREDPLADTSTSSIPLSHHSKTKHRQSGTTKLHTRVKTHKKMGRSVPSAPGQNTNISIEEPSDGKEKLRVNDSKPVIANANSEADTSSILVGNTISTGEHKDTINHSQSTRSISNRHVSTKRIISRREPSNQKSQPARNSLTRNSGSETGDPSLNSSDQARHHSQNEPHLKEGKDRIPRYPSTSRVSSHERNEPPRGSPSRLSPHSRRPILPPRRTLHSFQKARVSSRLQGRIGGRIIRTGPAANASRGTLRPRIRRASFNDQLDREARPGRNRSESPDRGFPNAPSFSVPDRSGHSFNEHEPISSAHSYIDHLRRELNLLPPICEHARELLQIEISRVQNATPADYLDLSSGNNLRLSVRVAIPAVRNPRVNLISKILGTNGVLLKELMQSTQTIVTILGYGSMKDKFKEEQLRRSGNPRYAHLKKPLHVLIESNAPPAEAYNHIAMALVQLQPVLSTRNRKSSPPGAFASQSTLESSNAPFAFGSDSRQPPNRWGAFASRSFVPRHVGNSLSATLAQRLRIRSIRTLTSRRPPISDKGPGARGMNMGEFIHPVPSFYPQHLPTAMAPPQRPPPPSSEAEWNRMAAPPPPSFPDRQMGFPSTSPPLSSRARPPASFGSPFSQGRDRIRSSFGQDEDRERDRRRPPSHSPSRSFASDLPAPKSARYEFGDKRKPIESNQGDRSTRFRDNGDREFRRRQDGRASREQQDTRREYSARTNQDLAYSSSASRRPEKKHSPSPLPLRNRGPAHLESERNCGDRNFERSSGSLREQPRARNYDKGQGQYRDRAPPSRGTRERGQPRSPSRERDHSRRTSSGLGSKVRDRDTLPTQSEDPTGRTSGRKDANRSEHKESDVSSAYRMHMNDRNHPREGQANTREGDHWSRNATFDSSSSLPREDRSRGQISGSNFQREYPQQAGLVGSANQIVLQAPNTGSASGFGPQSQFAASLGAPNAYASGHHATQNQGPFVNTAVAGGSYGGPHTPPLPLPSAPPPFPSFSQESYHYRPTPSETGGNAFAKTGTSGANYASGSASSFGSHTLPGPSSRQASDAEEARAYSGMISHLEVADPKTSNVYQGNAPGHNERARPAESATGSGNRYIHYIQPAGVASSSIPTVGGAPADTGSAILSGSANEGYVYPAYSRDAPPRSGELAQRTDNSIPPSNYDSRANFEHYTVRASVLPNGSTVRQVRYQSQGEDEQVGSQPAPNATSSNFHSASSSYKEQRAFQQPPSGFNNPRSRGFGNPRFHSNNGPQFRDSSRYEEHPYDRQSRYESGPHNDRGRFERRGGGQGFVRRPIRGYSRGFRSRPY